jgi:TRAP-type C4-dicarboxylate transport system substrate-binding protein
MGASEAARDALTEIDEDAIAELKELGVTFYTPTEEEMASFRDPVKEAAWPVAEEVMGTDRWDNLMSLTGESA